MPTNDFSENDMEQTSKTKQNQETSKDLENSMMEMEEARVKIYNLELKNKLPF